MRIFAAGKESLVKTYPSKVLKFPFSRGFILNIFYFLIKLFIFSKILAKTD